MKRKRPQRIRPWRFYVVNGARMLLPRWIKRWQLRCLLKDWEKRPDAEYIRDRVDFYCLLSSPFEIPQEGMRLKDIRLSNTHSRYYFDLQRVTDGFPQDRRVGFVQGDILENPKFPSLMKGRRLIEGMENGVILNLDKIRHFCQPNDHIPFEEKEPLLIFRGEADGKPARLRFLEMWADHPLCDLGDTDKRHKTKWYKERIPMGGHFKYQFILTLEGNDVSSALMWVMASNSIPVMPKPTVESWLMHSRLIPGVHYIEIQPDFSDVGEKIEYYKEHPEEAKRIAEASKEWIRQFADNKREKLIAALVVDKYLRLANPQ